MAITDWYQWAIEPKSSDEDDRRRERILNIILASSIIMLVVFDAVIAYYSLREGAAYRDMPLAEFSLIPAGFIVLYWLSRRGFFVAVSYAVIGIYFASISYAALRWGVNLPAALLGYAVLVTIASILISARFGFITAAAISGFMLIIWHFQFYDILPVDVSTTNNSDALIFSILLFLLTTIAWLSNREIERSLGRARRSEQNLELKVEERTRALQAAQAEKIDQLYRFVEFGQLASGLFHDLLNVIHAATLHDEKTMTDARTIHEEVERFRKAFQNQLHPASARQLFSMRRIIEEAIQLLGYQAKRDSVEIRLHAAQGDEFALYGDSLKASQMVVNLMLNAIEAFEGGKRFSDKRRVDIRLERRTSDVIMRVEDNGPGISDDLKIKIFDQLFTTKHGARQGTGIGLSVTKRIAEHDFGGDISVQDNPGGHGTVFIVRFPAVDQSNESTNAPGENKAMYPDYPAGSAF